MKPPTTALQLPVTPIRVVPVPAVLPPMAEMPTVVMSPPPMLTPQNETVRALQELQLQYFELQTAHNDVMDTQVAPLQERLADVAELLNQEMLAKRGLDILLTERDNELKVLNDVLQRQKLMEYVSKKAKEERINELEKKVRFDEQSKQEHDDQGELIRELQAQIKANDNKVIQRRVPHDDAINTMKYRRSNSSRGRGGGTSRGRESRRGRTRMEAIRKELVPKNTDTDIESVQTDPQASTTVQMLSDIQRQSEASRKSAIDDKNKLLNLISDMSADGELHSGTQVMIENNVSVDTELQPTAPAPTPPAGPTIINDSNTKEELAEVYAKLNEAMQELNDLQQNYEKLTEDSQVEKAMLAQAVVQAEEEAKATKETLEEQQELQNNQIKESEDQRDHFKDVDEAHQQEKAALQKIIQQLRTALTQAASDNQDLDKRNISLNNDVRKLAAQLSEDNKKNVSNSHELDDIRIQLQRAQAVIASLHTDNQQYIDRLQELEATQLKENLSTTSKIATLKGEGESLLAEIQQQELKQIQTLDKLASALSENEAMEQEINALTKSITQERLAADSERRRADENDIVSGRLRAEAQRARSDVEKLRSELDRQSAIFPGIEEALKRHSDEVTSVQFEKSRLSHTIEKQTVLLSESLEETSALSSQNIILTEKVVSLKGVNDSVRADLSAALQVQQRTEALLVEEEHRSVTAEAELRKLEIKFKEISAKSEEISLHVAAQRRNMSPIREAVSRSKFPQAA